MKIIFMGTPDFSVPCLKRLIDDGHDILAVFTREDKPVGRKQILTAPPVKKLALEHNIPVFQPKKLRDNTEMIDTIRNMGLVDVVVVITRYFGGTLLGTGGLVRAYSASAKEGLYESGIITRIMCDIISVKTEYDLVGKLQYHFATNGNTVTDTVYENDVTFFVASPKSDTERLISELIEVTNGRAEIEKVAEQYINKEENENGD